MCVCKIYPLKLFSRLIILDMNNLCSLSPNLTNSLALHLFLLLHPQSESNYFSQKNRIILRRSINDLHRETPPFRLHESNKLNSLSRDRLVEKTNGRNEYLISRQKDEAHNLYAQDKSLNRSANVDYVPALIISGFSAICLIFHITHTIAVDKTDYNH